MISSVDKILLIFPAMQGQRDALKPMCVPPLGLACLAAYLRNDYEVRILDATLEGYGQSRLLANRRIAKYGLSPDKIISRIKEIGPDVVGLSCLSSLQFEDIRQVCKLVKEWNKDVITVVGGGHPSFLAKECMNDPNIDFIVLGEGEDSFKQLLDSLRAGRTVSDIDGLAFRVNGEVVVNPKTRLIEDLDSIPFPARELLDMEKYFAMSYLTPYFKRRHPANMLTSRGCPHSCIFCSSTVFWGNKYRTRSVDNVIAEIEHLKERYGVEEIQFLDDNLTADKERAKSLFKEMIKRKLDINWCASGGIAVWTLDEEMLELMKESGCYLLSLAIESGSQEVINRIIKKPIDLMKLRLIVKKLKQLKMDAHAYMMIGLPGETLVQIKESLSFPQKLGLDFAHFAIATPLVGTELFSQCLRLGYVDNDFDFAATDATLSSFETTEFSSEELEKMAKRANIYYQFRIALRNPGKFLPVLLQAFYERPLFFLDKLRNI